MNDPTPAAIDAVAAQLKVLAHPTRLRIIQHLHKPASKGQQSVTEIYQALDIPQAICSQHLIVLKDRGLLKSNKVGTKIFYAIAAEAWCVQVVNILFKQIQ